MTLGRILQFTARTTGTLMVAFLIIVMMGAISGDSGRAGAPLFADAREALTFLTFPIFTMIGLALAWKYEFLGGLITLGSLAAVVLMQPEWLQPFALVPAVPGLLYAVHGVLVLGGPDLTATRHPH